MPLSGCSLVVRCVLIPAIKYDIAKLKSLPLSTPSSVVKIIQKLRSWNRSLNSVYSIEFGKMFLGAHISRYSSGKSLFPYIGNLCSFYLKNKKSILVLKESWGRPERELKESWEIAERTDERAAWRWGLSARDNLSNMDRQTMWLLELLTKPKIIATRNSRHLAEESQVNRNWLVQEI